MSNASTVVAKSGATLELLPIFSNGPSGFVKVTIQCADLPDHLTIEVSVGQLKAAVDSISALADTGGES